MKLDKNFPEFEEVINEMEVVYKHDDRPWIIGYSGGKDSSLLVSLVIETINRIPEEQRTKDIFIVSSDTGVENPIVQKYMHSSSQKINEFSKNNKCNIKAEIIYPEVKKTFWTLVIGLGYPTPEPPGFRWCTDRLKINPMNKYTQKLIDKNGEVILLLGVRKAESSLRNRSISNREIDGKILVPHTDFKNAFVYNPLTEIKNERVWEYLLKNDGKSSWGVDMKYLFSLYQGEDMGEEQSVIGQVDNSKIPVTGNSRFGCWCCTIVKEDKSLQKFIDNGSTELIPLRDFRNWLVSIRQNPKYRDNKRRNGKVYQKKNGEFGFGPFTLWARYEILKRLLYLQKETKFDLISMEELKVIDTLWDLEGDLSRRSLVDLYFEVFGVKLPWDKYKDQLYADDIIENVKIIAEQIDVPFELLSKLMVSVNNNKYNIKSSKLQKEFDSIINQEWIHYNKMKGDILDED